MKLNLIALALTLALTTLKAQTTQTFNFTGGMQTFTVPPCITSITVDVRGAQGANSQDKLITNATGGRGGRVTGVLAVTPGQVYNIFVGGTGNITGAGGFNGGGTGGVSSAGSSCFGGPAAGGGGASDIRFGGVALGNRIVVAGGGGGSGRDYCNGTCQPCGCGGNGGSGGLLTGVAGNAANNCGFSYPGTNVNGGLGGTQVAGGNGGIGDGGGPSGLAGTLGTGGTGAGGTYDVAGGGGGGGYYGGGGGGGASSGSGVGGGGGGGGSSFLGTLTSAVTTPSVQLGNGVVTISYLATASVAVVATNTQVCAGTSVTLTANGTLTYTWNTGSNANNIVVTPTTNTTYTVSGSNGSTCTASTTILIAISAPPLVPATNPSVCAGSAINLTSSGGSTYNWSGPLGYSSSAQNPTIVNATNPMSGAYTVTVTTAAGCSNTAVSNVTVINTPIANLVSNSPVCIGSTLTFTASGGVINLTGPNGFSSAASNPSVINVSALANGTYSLLVSAGTCTASTTTPVVINTLPVPTLSSNSPVCVNKPIVFSGGGGVSYSWTGPSGFTSSAQNPTIVSASAANGGTYSLTVTGPNGCTSFSTTAVNVNPLPVIAPLTNPTVCLNTTINLASNGGTSYSWNGPLGFTSPLQNPSLTNASIPMSGAYTVVVTSALGCSNSAVANVTVLNTPTANLLSNSPVCIGSVLSFTASGGTINLTGPNGFASAVSNPSILNVSALANGTYTLLVSAGTCTANITAAVVINPSPVPTLSSNSPVCINKPINFSGNGGVSYSWSGPNGFTSASQNPTIVSASAANAGTYSLTITGANGCTGFSTTAVAINPLPVIAPLTNPTVCLNTTINLNANGGNAYAWSGPLGFTSLLQNPNLTNASLAMSGAYSVIVTSAAGCTNSAISNVTVLSLPTPAITSNTPCIGSSLNLGASGGATYTWLGPNGFTSNLQNPIIANVIALASGNYSLIASVGTCSALTSSVVAINALPVVTAANSGPACATTSVQLTGGGATTYQWIGPNGFTSTSQNPIINSTSIGNSGTYTVVATNANNCTSTNTTALVINANPTPNATGASVCFGYSATLSASGGNSYVWSGPNGFTSTSANATIPSVDAAASGMYTVVVTNNGICSASTSVLVSANPIPSPTINGIAKACLFGTVALQGSGGLTYSWTGPGGFAANTQNVTIPLPSLSSGGNYTLTAVNNGGCVSSISIPVIVNPLPEAILSSDGKNSCAPFCANFNLQTQSGSSAIVNALWQVEGQTFNTPQFNYCFNNPGNISVKAIFTDGNGCSNTNTFAITAYGAPIANFESYPTKPVEGIDEVNFMNLSSGDSVKTWNWYFVNNNGATSELKNPALIFEKAGVYPVAMVVANKWGCTDTITKSVRIYEEFALYIPNSFTPNGDGLNEEFLPKGKAVEKYNMKIFNRWGQLVFETSEFEKGWDGKLKGVDCESDVYVWKITAENEITKYKEYSGQVNLIR